MHSEFTVAQAFHLFLALSNPSALPVRDIFYRYISDIPPRWCCAPGLGALAPNESIQTTTRTHTHTSLKNTSKKTTQTTDTLADLPEAPITHAAIELIVCCEHSLSLLKRGYILYNRRTLGFRNGVYALTTQSYSSTHHMLQTRAPCDTLRK